MNDDMAYIGRKSCGCLVAAIVDMPDHKDDVAEAVAEMLQGGLTVERVSCDTVRSEGWGCHCGGGSDD